MAQVSVSPAPPKLGSMSNRRVPLGNVRNAANSPFRAVAAAASKRSRDQVEAQEDLRYDLQPRIKRQALEDGRTSQRTPPRTAALQSAEGRVFNNRRPLNAQPTPFERKLLATKENKVQEGRFQQGVKQKPQQRVERQEKPSYEALDDLRAWQKHYKRSFPTFVFYFESVPEDVRIKYSKYVRSLGAVSFVSNGDVVFADLSILQREEKFFSKEVTHVVTTRPIPNDNDSKDTTDLITASSTSTSSQGVAQPRTINPSLLSRHHESQNQTSQSRSRPALEAPANKRSLPSGSRDLELKKTNAGNVDILSRAKDMGIRVWQLEKLQRIMNTMFDVPNEAQIQAGNVTRSRGANAVTRADREAELSRMLRHERLNGPSDRDSTVAYNELIPFRGVYIYIRDIDERTKPIMVQDYQRPSNPEEGQWPQFRSTRLGKCPFVKEEEPAQPTQQDVENVKARTEERPLANPEARVAPRTRAATIREDAGIGHSREVPQRKPLQESKYGANGFVQQPTKMPTQSFGPPPRATTGQAGSPAKAMRNVGANPGPRLFGGEPAASGMQPSNMTSAICSQRISSTAAAPGVKAGTSKEVHGLKRKVLEKNSGPALSSFQTRQRSLDPAGIARAERNIPTARLSRRQVQEPLIHIDEESTQSEEDPQEDVWLAEQHQSKDQLLNKGMNVKEKEQEDLKPGYCENCREKYNDFDHVSP